jgi:Tfp pilus assembly protein PilO
MDTDDVQGITTQQAYEMITDPKTRDQIINMMIKTILFLRHYPTRLSEMMDLLQHVEQMSSEQALATIMFVTMFGYGHVAHLPDGIGVFCLTKEGRAFADEIINGGREDVSKN